MKAIAVYKTKSNGDVDTKILIGYRVGSTVHKSKEKLESLGFSFEELPNEKLTIKYKMDGNNKRFAKYTNEKDEDGYLLPDLDYLNDILKKDRYKKLESIFNEKTVQLKLIAIDKPYMTNIETIQNQYQIYSEMYTNAKNGVYSIEKNAEIIMMNEAARSFLAEITILISAIRSVVEKAIESNLENIDELLTSFDDIILTKENINDIYLAEISTAFGL